METMAHARSLGGGWGRRNLVGSGKDEAVGSSRCDTGFKAGLQVNPETITHGLKHPRELSHPHWSLATAPQQEADAEASTDTGNKSSQSSGSSNAQPAPSETTSTSKEKETSAEKSKDSSVSTRSVSATPECSWRSRLCLASML